MSWKSLLYVAIWILCAIVIKYEGYQSIQGGLVTILAFTLFAFFYDDVFRTRSQHEQDD